MANDSAGPPAEVLTGAHRFLLGLPDWRACRHVLLGDPTEVRVDRRRPDPVRRLGGIACLLLALLFATGGALLAYAMASEYGASPERAMPADLSMSLRSMLPLLLVVAALVWFGLAGAATWLGARRRRVVTVIAVLWTLTVCGAGIALGQRALHDWCDSWGGTSSAMCPGHAGPGERVCNRVTGVCRPRPAAGDEPGQGAG